MMLKLTNSKEVNVVYKTETYSVDGKKNIELIVDKKNNKVRNYSFITSKSPSINFKDKLEYQYYRKEIFEACSKNHFMEIEYDKYVIPFEEFEHKNIDLNRVLGLYGGGHMIFRLSDLSPVSTLLEFDYTEGINDEYYNINDVFNHLKKHPFVKSVKREDIPYYNQTDNRTVGLYFEAYIPDKEMKDIWKLCKNNEYPTCEFNLILINRTGKYKIDVLGLKKFLKKQ